MTHDQTDAVRQRIVTDGRDEGFRPYDRFGPVIAGMSWKPLRYDAAEGTGSFLLRFDPGAASSPHEHGAWKNSSCSTAI